MVQSAGGPVVEIGQTRVAQKLHVLNERDPLRGSNRMV
jgi:hypothetical protein